MTSNNMYRVGDFVYFEVSASAPYQIRKIEELNKTPTGAVEAKVVCFYRRRDLSFNLVQLADKHQKELGISGDEAQPDLLHQIRHRELFLSRHLETLPATHIRGKCTVILHTESEPYHIYLSKDDTFFFQLVYDPLQKTLQADKGFIREGSQYQADVGPFRPPAVAEEKSHEELRWRPDNSLTSSDLDSYLLLVRSLATLGRAYYPAHVLRQPSLTMSAASAARDTTHQFAMDTLHQANYDISHALQSLAPNGQPVLKLDEMEQWSASEGNLFEEALEKYGKCFYEIQNDFLPWKHPKNLVEFYYMWKTTDHYIQQKRLKATEAEHHLKQVYIPNYNKPNPAVLYPPTGNCPTNPIPSGCEGCPNVNSPQWYALGPTNSPLKVCSDCWTYWKRYGDLKAASILDKVTESLPSSSITVSTSEPNSINPSKANIFKSFNDRQSRPISSTTNMLSSLGKREDLAAITTTAYALASKARPGVSFQYVASLVIRIARRLCRPVNPRRQARQPFRPLASLTSLHKDAFPVLSKLNASQLQKIAEKFRTPPCPTEVSTRGNALHTLISRLFPSKAGKPKQSTKNSNNLSISLTSEKNNANSVESALDLAINGVLANNVASSLKRRASSPKDDESAETSQSLPIKKVHVNNPNCSSTINTEIIPGNHGTVMIGPKRRFCVGTGEDEASTLMYWATQGIKRTRRKLLSLTELRRFGRRPWSELNVDTISHNGLHNGSNGNLKKKSNISVTESNLNVNINSDCSPNVGTRNPCSSTTKLIKP